MGFFQNSHYLFTEDTISLTYQQLCSTDVSWSWQFSNKEQNRAAELFWLSHHPLHQWRLLAVPIRDFPEWFLYIVLFPWILEVTGATEVLLLVISNTLFHDGENYLVSQVKQ